MGTFSHGVETSLGHLGERCQHINERLVELAHIQPGHQVVDMASGLGELAFTAARQVTPTGQVIGTNIAPEMLAKAREQTRALGLHQVTFCEMDAEEPDLPRAAFNAIYAGLVRCFFLT